MLTALRRCSLFLGVSGLGVLFLACASTSPPAADPEAAESVRAAPTTAWIVQGTDLASVKRAVLEVGGRITHELAIIRAVGAELTATQLAALEKHAGVTRIYQDRKVGIDASGPGD